MPLGFRQPRSNLPQIQLWAVVVSGNKVYKKKLPIEALSVANFQIFTRENVDAIKQFPDVLEER